MKKNDIPVIPCTISSMSLPEAVSLFGMVALVTEAVMLIFTEANKRRVKKEEKK